MKDLKRRAEADEDFAEQLRESQNQRRRERNAARKQAETVERELRSRSAKKGWETRRRKPLEAQYVARTELQREELKKANRARKMRMDFAFVPDAVKFDVSKLKQQFLTDLILEMRDSGVKSVRITREVPPTPDYPTGVVSTRWVDIRRQSDQQLKWWVGSMMQPGIDRASNLYTTADDIPSLPKPIRDAVVANLRR